VDTEHTLAVVAVDKARIAAEVVVDKSVAVPAQVFTWNKKLSRSTRVVEKNYQN
jgi:hypothetical protein